MNRPESQQNTANVSSSPVYTPDRKKRGLKPGQVHSGSFKRGFDERRLNQNPGKAAFVADVQELASGYKPELVEMLIGMARDNATPQKLRLNVIRELLDRTEGRPVERTQLLAITGQLPEQANNGPTEQLSDERLVQLLLETRPYEQEETFDDEAFTSFEEIEQA